MARYTDKIVVVIGGNSGIGLASAEAFAAEGAIVVLTGRDRETVAAMAARIGPAATGIAADIADTNARASLFADIKQRFAHAAAFFLDSSSASAAKDSAIRRSISARSITPAGFFREGMNFR